MLFDRAEASFGPIDVLVNNAGILKVSPLAEVADEDYQHQIAVNLTGTFNGMREGARRVRDGARIINLSTSIIGAYLPAHGVCMATKAAVEAITHILAKELGTRGVTVNAVAPGPVATKLFLTGRSEELIRHLTNDILLTVSANRSPLRGMGQKARCDRHLWRTWWREMRPATEAGAQRPEDAADYSEADIHVDPRPDQGEHRDDRSCHRVRHVRCKASASIFAVGGGAERRPA